MPKPVAYDVAVAGAGSFGAWIAYTLARRGKRVLLADPHGPGNARSSSGGETRIIRMSYGADALYTEMSHWSLGEWKKLAPELFVPCGALFTALPGFSHFEASFSALRQAGIGCERLTPRDLKRRYPQIQLAPRSVGLFEPASGVLMARLATQAAVQAAVEAGAVFEPVGITPNEFRRRFRAEHYVFACGPWLPELFPEALGRKIFPTRQDVFFFGVPANDSRFRPPAMPAWVDFSSEIYAVPDIGNRGLKVALHRHGPRFDPENGSRVVTAAAVRRMSSLVAEWLPALRGAPVVESRVCQYENSSNGDFIIDQLEPGVWVAGAGSGHGFKHGPAVGAYVADLIYGKRAPEARFALAGKGSIDRRTVY